MLYKGKLYRAELYCDNAYPYSDVREIHKAYAGRYPGKKLVVTNADGLPGDGGDRGSADSGVRDGGER